MNKFSIQIRWADIDQNRHLRHSAYYDYGAMIRMKFFTENGLTTDKLEEWRIGPILFREEAVFRREIRLEDKITMDVELVKAKSDYSRWTLRHQLRKEDDSLAATITIDGAWIDMDKRKLAVPNEFIIDAFKHFPKAEDFQFI